MSGRYEDVVFMQESEAIEAEQILDSQGKLAALKYLAQSRVYTAIFGNSGTAYVKSGKGKWIVIEGNPVDLVGPPAPRKTKYRRRRVY